MVSACQNLAVLPSSIFSHLLLSTFTATYTILPQTNNLLLLPITMPAWWDPFGANMHGLEKTIDKHATLYHKLLVDTEAVPKVLFAGELLAAGISFAQACYGVAAITKVIVGNPAERALSEFYKQLGKDISSISKDIHILVNNQNQQDFGRHVFRFWKWHHQGLEEDAKRTGRKHFTFIFHQGNEWHPLFKELLDEHMGQMTGGSTSIAKGDPVLIGMFDNLNLLTAAMQIVRRVVGTDAKFHVLFPANDLTVIKEPLAFPPEVYPVSLQGQTHTSTGTPYYHLNMPGAQSEMFRDVSNMGEVEPAEPERSFGRKAGIAGAQIGAGVGGGIAGTIAGVLCTAIAVTVCPPLAVVEGAICIAGVLGGAAAAGTASAISAGESVKEGHAKDDLDAANERARKMNAAATCQ